jgi:hypothetical protein
VNLTGYVRANPRSKVDPTGLEDANFFDPTDPLHPLADLFDDGDYFTFGGHRANGDSDYIYGKHSPDYLRRAVTALNLRNKTKTVFHL